MKSAIDNPYVANSDHGSFDVELVPIPRGHGNHYDSSHWYFLDWLDRMSMFDIALDYQRERTRFPKLMHLDYRELTLARLLAAGCSRLEAGVRLGLNLDAIEATRLELLRKLGLNSERDLVGKLDPAGSSAEVTYIDDFRISYFESTSSPCEDDVVFAD